MKWLLLIAILAVTHSAPGPDGSDDGSDPLPEFDPALV